MEEKEVETVMGWAGETEGETGVGWGEEMEDSGGSHFLHCNLHHSLPQSTLHHYPPRGTLHRKKGCGGWVLTQALALKRGFHLPRVLRARLHTPPAPLTSPLPMT